ncbi:MAG: hypothetical protein IKQ52_11610 [Bacteroidales bacterium]|nr:hypothetical protein [Bacteroidales bacterium]
MKGKIVVVFIILVFSTIGCLSAQTTDTMYVVKRHVVRDTVYVRDTVRVQDTIIIADYIHSEEFKRLFYELSGADGQTPSDSLEKLWAQTVTFLENRVIQYEQQNVSTMDSIKKYGLAGLMLLGLNSLAPAQTPSPSPTTPHQTKVQKVLHDSPFNGFHFGYTAEADIVHPVEMTSYATAKTSFSSVRYGGRVGLEFSYHFADYFGVSSALDFGYIGSDKSDIFCSYSGVSMPLKFEFHYPVADKLWVTANAGVQLRMPWETFLYGYNPNEGRLIANLWYVGNPVYYTDYCPDRHVFYADLMADVGLYYQLPNQDYLRFLAGLNIATTDWARGGVELYSMGYEELYASQRNHYLYFQMAYLHSFSKQRAIKQAQQHWTADKSLYRNEFRLGVSDPFGLWLLKNEQVDFLWIGDSWKSIIKENRHFTPVFSFDYHFRASKWFWLGLTTACSYYKGTVDYVEGIVAAVDLPNVPVYSWQEKEHQFVIMPEVRLSYLNRPHVTLYSGLAVGVLFNRGNCYRGGTVPENLYHPDENHTSAFAAFQLTAFGVKAGAKHWFGSFELGAGIKGFANLGVGYEF